jgi:hypothetical protein
MGHFEVSPTGAEFESQIAERIFWGPVERQKSPRREPVPILLLGLVSIAWAGFSLVTGKGYYKGCPPGGWDRAENPFNYWIPTIIILAIGVSMILVFLGLIPLPSRALHG